MSEYSDLPDNIKKALENLLETLAGMSPEQIFELIRDLFGDAGLNEITDLINENEEFQIRIEHDDSELSTFMDDFDDFFSGRGYFQDLEPYYEINHQGEGGEIIIEMPGLGDHSQIDWYEWDNEIFIHTIDSIENYKIVIPLPEYYELLDQNIVYRNGLLIIPFEIR